jgi:hypothetical protein
VLLVLAVPPVLVVHPQRVAVPRDAPVVPVKEVLVVRNARRQRAVVAM